MKLVNKIERTIILPVAQERVWAAITVPEKMAKWFAPECDINYEPGGSLRLVWENGDVSRGVVEAIEPPSIFSFRWHARPVEYTDPLTSENSTVVTFRLETVNSGTRLTVTEEGFAGLPDIAREQVLSKNTVGWKARLAGFEQYVGQVES